MNKKMIISFLVSLVVGAIVFTCRVYLGKSNDTITNVFSFIMSGVIAFPFVSGLILNDKEAKEFDRGLNKVEKIVGKGEEEDF